MRWHDLRIGYKIAAMAVLSLIGLVAVIPIAGSTIRDRMIEDRRAKVKSLVELGHGIIRHFHEFEKSGVMSREQAQAATLASLENVRYEGDGYFFINGMNYTVVMLPPNHALVGKDVSQFRTKSGELLFQNYVQMIHQQGEGFHDYLWPKPGTESQVLKTSYIKGFLPWGWYIGTGVYVDDIDTEFWRIAKSFGSICAVLAAIVLALSWLIGRGLARSITEMAICMRRLANGDLEVVLPGVERRDEIGEIAHAVNIFKKNAETKAKNDADTRVEQDRTLVLQRRAELEKFANEFEAAVGTIIEGVSSSSAELESAAHSLTAIAETTQNLSINVAAASADASVSVQSAAGATEEMHASIREIDRQVSESSKFASDAVRKAEQTDSRVSTLSEAAGRIGDVIKLINSVAEQTNLLALNATIEAARAGEAGKGFAVVAQEVKALAAQTAKATEEISSQIVGMQAATDESVDAIKNIGGTITQISEIISVVAGAVGKQGAATQDISRNVGVAAQRAVQVAGDIERVKDGAQDTGLASAKMLVSAQSLSYQSAELRRAVDKFLSTVRAA